MPAGAFAASGPTSDESSKARSRRARGTQAVRSPWQTMNLAHANDETWQQRCGAASDLAEEQNCLEKVFRDNVVGIDAVADAGPRCARRPHAAAKPAESAWCSGTRLTCGSPKLHKCLNSQFAEHLCDQR